MFSKLSHKTNTTPTPAGRLCSKLQDFTATGNIYAYSTNNKPHAARRIYNGITNELSNLRWDNNGNLAQQTVYSVANNATTYQGMRYLQWDEDDRLNLVAGDGYLSYYAYGHDGNRAVKMTGNAAIDQTGTLLNSTNLENITIYPSEYLTVTQAEYTKYYYAGGNRIASKIGTGGFEKMTRLCTLDQGPTYNANTLLNFVLYQVTNTTQPPTDEYPVDVCGGYSVAAELLADPLPDFYISQTNLNFTQNNLLQQFRQNLTNAVEPVYYFHSDHLGSASWITNNTGLPVQHLLYLPFGEHFVNERNTAYNERFTFTGKERDAETGYYYHGARFNNSDIGWLSVDPMADKYSEITPYHYCHWNPIKLVDLNGTEDELDYYLNLRTGLIEHHEGSENRLYEGLVRLAGDNATIGDIEDELLNKGYNYYKDPSVQGGFRVDTEKQLKGWMLWKGIPSYANMFESVLLGPILESLSEVTSSFNLFRKAKFVSETKNVSKLSESNYSNVEDLINNSGKLERLKKGVRQGFVKGDANKILKDLSKNYKTPLKKKGNELYFESGNTRVGIHESTKGGGTTIHINHNGKTYKIRVAE